MCRLIWEWIYAKQSEPQDTEGHFGGLGGHKSKSPGRLSNGWTDLHQIWYTSADSSGNGHRLNKICPRHWGGGVGVTHSKVREDVKRLDRLAPILVHGSNGTMTVAANGANSAGRNPPVCCSFRRFCVTLKFLRAIRRNLVLYFRSRAFSRDVICTFPRRMLCAHSHSA